MTRSELILRLHLSFPHLTQEDVGACVGTILQGMTDTLASGKRVEIRGFGAFQVHIRPGRQGRNPRTGKLVVVPAKQVPHFRPGQELRRRATAVRQGTAVGHP